MDEMTVVDKETGAVRYVLTADEVRTPELCDHKFDAEGRLCVFCSAKKEEKNEF